MPVSCAPYTHPLLPSVIEIALQLLDSSQSQPLQTWEFADSPLLRIGRAAENDVVVGNPYVSRAHAYLRFVEGEWELCVLSQHGVFLDGARIDSVRLREGMVFRLAAKGPFLRVTTADAAAGFDARSTAAFDSHAPLLRLDASERDQQVDEIAGGEYFQQLQNKARQLRNKRDTIY